MFSDLGHHFGHKSKTEGGKTQKRTPNHKHPDKHAGGHCAAAQLDPHGALGHPSVLAEFAGPSDICRAENFADKFIFADICRYLLYFSAESFAEGPPLPSHRPAAQGPPSCFWSKNLQKSDMFLGVFLYVFLSRVFVSFPAPFWSLFGILLGVCCVFFGVFA